MRRSLKYSQIDNMSPAFSFSIVLLQSFSVLLPFFNQLYGMHAVCKCVDRAIMCLRVTPVSPHCLAPSSVSPHPVLVLDPALMRLVSPLARIAVFLLGFATFMFL